MEIMWDILASIYYGKCTYEELCQRDFLKTVSEYGINLCLQQLEVKGFIKLNKNDEYVALPSAKKELARRGYFD